MNEEFWVDFVLGVVFCGLLCSVYHRFKVGSYQQLGREMMIQAEREADKIRHAAEVQAHQKSIEHQSLLDERRMDELRKMEKEAIRLRQKEDRIEERRQQFDKKGAEIEKKEKDLKIREQALEQREAEQQRLTHALRERFEQLSGLTTAEAHQKFLEELHEEVRRESAQLIRQKKAEAEEEADRQAAWILSAAIQRLAVPTTSQMTTYTVPLPNDEIKGRIIGKEGRNIRTLERCTGVTFLIDDTPGAIVLSGFDSVRLNTAREALVELVKDGRIHPTRIEEVVEKARQTIDRKILEYGEEAAHTAGQFHFRPEILKLLGKLKFLHSIGQNVLEHSLEVSHLMGMIAAELHLDVSLAKRIGLLHDIGKAVSHEMPGTHALIGRDLALKYGESPEVANGIGCHHHEIAPLTVEASFCAAADAISASRLGARIEAAGEYLKRMHQLEEIAHQFSGVEKAYVMQAGKELCITVEPQTVDDAAASALAKELTKRIEQELNYKGKIKITVIREKRSVQYAL